MKKRMVALAIALSLSLWGNYSQLEVTAAAKVAIEHAEWIKEITWESHNKMKAELALARLEFSMGSGADAVIKTCVHTVYRLQAATERFPFFSDTMKMQLRYCKMEEMEAVIREYLNEHIDKAGHKLWLARYEWRSNQRYSEWYVAP